jgi:hypothetical protein
MDRETERLASSDQLVDLSNEEAERKEEHLCADLLSMTPKQVERDWVRKFRPRLKELFLASPSGLQHLSQKLGVDLLAIAQRAEAREAESSGIKVRRLEPWEPPFEVDRPLCIQRFRPTARPRSHRARGIRRRGSRRGSGCATRTASRGGDGGDLADGDSDPPGSLGTLPARGQTAGRRYP